ncbi:chemotaxis protein CheW [Comamonas humi]
MANQGDLRALQARLAERLDQAREQKVSGAAWLAVKAAGQGYLLPLSQSGEVLPWSGVTPVPYTKPWMLGVASLRGLLLTVVDLALMLGQPARRTEGFYAEAKLVVLNPLLGVHAALLVEQLEGLRRVQDFARSQPPADEAPPFVSASYVAVDGQAWQELDLQKLAESRDFLDISA